MGCTFTQTSHQDAPSQPFSPIPGSMLLYYISYKRQHGSACVITRCGVQSSGNFASFQPTCVVLSRYVSSLVTAWQGPRGLPSPRIFMVLGGMKAAFVPSPSPGPWRARLLDSAVWTLVFGWPQLRLLSPLRFPSWSRYILGSFFWVLVCNAATQLATHIFFLVWYPHS